MHIGPHLVIVHDGAPGVDQSFSESCRHLGTPAEPQLADWKGLSNIAGPQRDQEMVQAGSDLRIEFRRTLATSKGTKNCIRQAIAAGTAYG
jgi:hypothetical protein